MRGATGGKYRIKVEQMALTKVIIVLFNLQEDRGASQPVPRLRIPRWDRLRGRGDRLPDRCDQIFKSLLQPRTKAKDKIWP